jgi:hypothetical protein
MGNLQLGSGSKSGVHIHQLLELQLSSAGNLAGLKKAT